MTDTRPRILLLEDSALDAELIEEQLAGLDPRVERVVGRADYEAALRAGGHDVILSDFSLPGYDGMSALHFAVENAPEIPFIFVSGVLGEEAAIDAFRKGATDYVLKQRIIRLGAAVERALAEAHERRERRRAERQKDLLVRELSHRVKNNLAVIMSIIRRTARGSATIDEFVDKLSGRIQAMAEAHSLLFEDNWNEADIMDVLTRAVSPVDGRLDRVEVREPLPVKLEPRYALALAMIFNELVTNASKYGALSTERGRVAISWSVERQQQGSHLHLQWQERDGPAVTAPDHEGFGTTLIRSSVVHELAGSVQFDFQPTGFACDIVVPLASGS